MEDGRPSPEEMLARAAREAERAARGRLKIFFGALPGVGKTYAMLAAARELAATGRDVAIGWVETHGRAETAKLAEGLERLVPRRTEHRGVTLAEFDLDAALARRPALLLLDELAHTNAPGSRHARRWQDALELVRAGIDVWTTLNVQHVESLNDVVAGATGVTVRETVPDALIDAADEIELVDLPPDDLLQRLKDGKIYVPERAAEAERNFFRKGNVMALRELALRRAALRVELESAEYRREHGLAETRRTEERLLVAFEHSRASADLLRAARRMAEALHAPLIALTVEDPRFERLPEARREASSENVALAQRLGAETLVVRGDDVAAEVVSVARERGVTRILAGRPRSPRWRALLSPSRTERIVRAAGAIDVLVTAGEPEGGVVERVRFAPPAPRQLAREYALALAAVVAPTLLCALTARIFTFADQAMLFLLGVLVVSSRLTRGPALLNAFASVAALDFFFVEPDWSFAVADLRYVVTFGVVFVVAFAVSRRTVLMREQADLARERERRAASLYVMSRDFARARSFVEVADVAAQHVRAVLGRECVVLAWHGPGRLERLAGAAFDATENARDAAVAAWACEYARPAGRGTDTLPASAYLFLPLANAQTSRGTLGIALGPSDELSPSQRQLVETFAAQTALALERVQLETEASRARLAAETERTRSTLLSSVGHDLRIPLSAIGGAAQVLLDESRAIGAADRRELLGTIRDEGERLARLVANLLDLTRLESGALVPKKEWVPVDEVFASALDRVRARSGARAIEVDAPEDVLEVHGDPALLELALVNLLDNALKHTPPGTEITLRARREVDDVVLAVLDRGPGLKGGDETRVFERFYRSADSHGVEGTGLGLAVVDAIARTHGGKARALARRGGGAQFELVIPGARSISPAEDMP